MSTPQQLTPPVLPSAAALTFFGRSMGKTLMMQQALRDLGRTIDSFAYVARRGTPTLIIMDELSCSWRPNLVESHDHRDEWYRGGRYRRPPVASKERPPEAGMVQVRDRTGKLVWKKIGQGRERLELQENPLFGAF